MNILKKIVNFFLKKINLQIISYRHTYDEIIPKIIIKKNPVIFDVGANKGQSIKRFMRLYKNPEIHSFEPLYKLYIYLKDNFDFKNVKIINKALGSVSGSKKIFLNNIGNYGAMTSFYKLIKNSKYHKNYIKVNEFSNKLNEVSEQVSVITLDSYVKKYSISSIDYLKIDVQGWEAEVLKGSKKALRAGIIKNIELEFMMSDAYNFNHSISNFDSTLKENNYKLIAIDNYGDVIHNHNLALNLLYQKT